MDPVDHVQKNFFKCCGFKYHTIYPVYTVRTKINEETFEWPAEKIVMFYKADKNFQLS